ncbi:MAG: aryl-sulfate sulfotransferase [Bryobacteraceae bacterium]|jgi:hypothetical protein
MNLRMRIMLLALLWSPAYATVEIVSMTPSLPSPQPIGSIITWTATATNSKSSRLTFQFNVTRPNGSSMMIKDFNVGTDSNGVWSAQPFVWALTGVEGNYKVGVVAKDFTSGQNASQTVSFDVTSPLTGDTPVVQATPNPLVALFSAPSCPAGSTWRVWFQPQFASVPATTTDWVGCQPAKTMTTEIAGMYPSTTYNLYAQTNTGGYIVDGPTVNFTTGPIPASVPVPTFTVVRAASPTDPYPVLIQALFSTRFEHYPDVATDLAGNIIWYNYAGPPFSNSMMTRPLPDGAFLAIQSGDAWDPGVTGFQFLRQIDWAGNIVQETNTGVIQQELLALGAVDANPCNKIHKPPAVGSACLGVFHHDAIRTLPNSYVAVLTNIEKIFPPGTQGDTSGLPVDIVGDMIVVLDNNWQAVWYWDAFDPTNGGNGYPLLPVTRKPVLGEVCTTTNQLCLETLLLGPGVSPNAPDWLHGNSLYYWPAPQDGNTKGGDLIFSSRHQDWVMKIDYQDGAGTGDVLWRMGPSGDFAFKNIFNDPWPWFSHQHDAGVEDNGAGDLTVLDNGNTRVSPPSGPGSSTGGVPGLGSNCQPSDCNSRGLALEIDQATLEVTPVLSMNLGVYAFAMGSAQLLGSGNYFFLSANVASLGDVGFDMEIQPTQGTGGGVKVLDLKGPSSYRTWQVSNLYNPPTT